MAIKHLDHLNMSVSNFDETAAWYGRVFGFEIVEQGVEDGQPWGVIKAGEAMLCIYQHPERQPRTKKSLMKTGMHFMSHFGLRIDNRAEWLETVKREKVRVGYGGEVRWPHSSAWYVEDPNGYEIEVALWDGDSVRFD